MKRIIALIITALLCFSVGIFAACGGEESTSGNRSENEQSGGNTFTESEQKVDNSTAHKWGSWQTVIYPDCVENGLKISHCTECGVSKMEIIPALNHTSEKCENNQSEHYRICTRCGEKYDVAEHSFAADLSCACGYTCDYTLGLEYEKIEGKEEYRVKGDGEFSGDIITVPATYKGLPITEIGEYAFQDAAAKKIVLPESIKNIGCQAFSYSDVEEVVMPKFLETLGGAAFYACFNLEKIVLPDGLKRIENTTFYQCFSLQKIVIPDSVTEIGYQAFDQCYTLTSITLGKNLESIESAFSQCGRLIEVYNRSVLPVEADGTIRYGGVSRYAKNVYKIGVGLSSLFTTDEGIWYYEGEDSVILLDYMGNDTSLTIPDTIKGKPCILIEHSFYNTDGLEHLTVSGGIKTIPSFSFNGMSSLSDLILEEGVEKIENDCFKSNKLSLVKIPASLVSIGSGTFGKNITEIDIAEDNPVYEFKGNCLIDKQTKTLLLACKDFVIPTDGSVEIIGDYAFAFVTQVDRIEIPSSVRKIGTRAFFYSEFSEIILNEGLESIGIEAFADCANLTEINIPSTVKEIYASAFVGSPIEKVNFVNTDGWVIFKRSSDVEGEDADADRLGDPLQAAEYIKEVEKNADLYTLARWERNL